MISLFAKLVAAGLEALLDHDAYALDRSARLSDNVYQPVDGLAVCHEVVDDEHTVALIEVIL